MKVTHIYGPMNESNRYIYGTMKGICVLGIYSSNVNISGTL